MRNSAQNRQPALNRNFINPGQNLFSISAPRAVGDIYSKTVGVTVTPYSWATEVGESYAVNIPLGASANWAYMYFSPSSKIYTFSVFVQMSDNSAPVIADASGSSDFMLLANTAAVVGTVSMVNNTNVYRCKYTGMGIPGSFLFGVVKFVSNSSKTVKVTGWQIEERNGAGKYVSTYGSAYNVGPVRNFAVGRVTP